MHSSTHSSQMNTVGPAISFTHLMLTFAAEAAVEGVFAVGPLELRRHGSPFGHLPLKRLNRNVLHVAQRLTVA